MRITLFVGRADLGGGARVIATYAERLHRRGHEVTVISRPPRKPTWRERMRKVLRGTPLPMDTQPSPTYFDDKPFTFRYLDRWRPATAADVPDADVVIATWWETAEWVAAFPASKGAKVYFLQGYEVLPGMPVDRVHATWRLPMHKIVVAQWLADLARDKFGDPEVSLVHNSVDLDLFHAPPRGKQATPTVGLVYSTYPIKGTDVSLKAFALAKQKLPDLKLVVFGGEPLSEAMPLPAGVEFVHRPPQAQIRDFYASCDAWLWGSRQEGFGLPLLEAMACRTPVIATPAGASPELVARSGGFLVPQEDAGAMADAIVKVCGLSDAAWRELSDRAHATAAGYTWDDAAARFEAVLERVVSDRAGRPAPEPRRPRDVSDVGKAVRAAML